MTGAAKALVLQGGGALGAYQAGVYEALLESDNRLDWVAGVSIGAVNAALIAGNAPGQRVDRLREFWREVSSGPAQNVPLHWGDRAVLNQWSAAAAMLAGIPGFFRPRADLSLLMGGAAPLLSFYDTAPLKATLERLVDFDRINRREMRLSVGAVNVRSGNSIYFDNATQRIGVEHIMASGALPPGFPPVHIDGQDYWDGGLLSNTPLQYVLDSYERNRRLVILQVDLFSARGSMPRTLSEVIERQKDITYSSRTRMNTDAAATHVNLQQAVADLIAELPARRRSDASIVALRQQMKCEPIDIVHLIYRDKPYELDSKDYEFSRGMVEEHWNAGVRDMRNTIAHPEWLRSATENGVTTFDLAQPGPGRVRHPAPQAEGGS
ncbi:MAG TPA: patatin-like phospholipase family protein [Ramlibacter sp.]|nr:patatin-like phospholipase family protein [Ramlibacter sp.]HVZ45706.1 patatin-like phospholipase family protein [Ramlibacter sp.]